jgi:hypothetical protein
MSVLIPRTRTLGVRLSSEEYAALERWCAENGARSLSDLARNALLNHVNYVSREGLTTASASQHSTKVNQLEEKLETLAAELASLKSGIRRQLSGDASRKEADLLERSESRPAVTRTLERTSQDPD